MTVIYLLAFLGWLFLFRILQRWLTSVIFKYNVIANAADLYSIPNSCALHAVKCCANTLPNERIVRGFLSTRCLTREGSMVEDIDDAFAALKLNIDKYEYYPLREWVAKMRRRKDQGPYFCIVWVKGLTAMHATAYKDGKIIDSNFTQKAILNSHFIGAYKILGYDNDTVPQETSNR